MLTNKQLEDVLQKVLAHTNPHTVCQDTAKYIVELYRLNSVQQKVFISSPLTTGKFEATENALIIGHAFKYVQDNYDLNLFNCLQLEDIIHCIFSKLDENQSKQFVKNFYGTIFAAGNFGNYGNKPFIKLDIFLPLWKYSGGAQDEYKLAKQHNIQINTQLLPDYRFLDRSSQRFFREKYKNDKEVTELFVGYQKPVSFE